MELSYNKLWTILIDKDLKKKDLCNLADICTTSLAKLKRRENVTTDILLKFYYISGGNARGGATPHVAVSY